MAPHGIDIESYRPKLRYKVRTHVGLGSNDVEDLVQETIFRFLRAMDTGRLRNPDMAGAFLYGICKNVIFEYHKNARREEPLEENHPEPRNPGLTDVEKMELRESTKAVMRELPPRDRSLLCACYLEEKEREDVLAVTGMNAAQLRVVLCRARKRFRDLYTQSGWRPGAQVAGTA